jgi:hypothetical protein
MRTEMGLYKVKSRLFEYEKFWKKINDQLDEKYKKEKKKSVKR